MDGEIFESGKKKLRIQKYHDTCGRGRNHVCVGIELISSIRVVKFTPAFIRSIHVDTTPPRKVLDKSNATLFEVSNCGLVCLYVLL